MRSNGILTGNPKACSTCAHGPDYVAAFKLLPASWAFPSDICCHIRPPYMLLCYGEGPGMARDMRVWPGADGLELFRLQLQALLGGPPHEDEVSFVVRIGREDTSILLPGLSSYGVASYCAAIGAALGPSMATDDGSVPTAEPRWGMESVADGSPHQPQPQSQPRPQQQCKAAAHQLDSTHATSDSCCEDDWIDLLCSVADLLEGEGNPKEKRSGGNSLNGPATSAAQSNHGLRPSVVTVWACVDRRLQLFGAHHQVLYF
ncbi:hypothetical protein Vretimale_8931 [Volvox reticuliferus]|uniref:Uncharacterized protein n=1 Tax=Volvox reticuliferus TaxID=1737510 RepID=A0A8J4LN87_9CHLO|nr:hypothetical protein Vretifemale_14386 [Volvox reticuliferus]GIM04349.1 hypothetical protein Vretimale_8931 [Volvox reticuliferus]